MHKCYNYADKIRRSADMKHIVPIFQFPVDEHKISQNADFSTLDKMYEGRVAYYGDYHAHSNSGGMSDGKVTLEGWLAGMKEQHIDFIGVMDHRQIRHMYLDEFDPEYFIYGTEPAGEYIEPYLCLHYLMIFEERDTLGKILEAFPDVFEFTGGIEGRFEYKAVERDRFMEVVKAVRDLGGVFVHAHPRQVMVSDNIDDFYFGDGTTIETIYTNRYAYPHNIDTINNYLLWLQFLDSGKKVYNTATSDCHRAVSNQGLNTVYSNEKNGPAYVRKLREGDLNAGFIGIKMCIDECPVGSTIKYKDGMKLYLKIEDTHPLLYKPEEKYRVDIITDKGLAYSAPLTMPFALSVNVEKRRFYRVEIIRERDGSPAAIGNPIWVEE